MPTVLRCERSASVGTATVNVGSYAAPSVTTGVVITGLVCVNRSASTITVTVTLAPGSDTQPAALLASGVTILPGGQLVLADNGNRIVMNPTNVVQAVSSVAASLDVIMSVAEIT